MNKVYIIYYTIILLLLNDNFNSNNNVSMLIYAQSPTPNPTVRPTVAPTYPIGHPTPQPTRSPTYAPTTIPTNPTKRPFAKPTGQPTTQPSSKPSIHPTQNLPTPYPSSHPTSQPTRQPSTQPSRQPTSRPSTTPSSQPSRRPTSPSGQPSSRPSRQPSAQPSSSPSRQPTSQPSSRPTKHVSFSPTRPPTLQPTLRPTFNTAVPTPNPTIAPSMPTGQPSADPSQNPIAQPTSGPSTQPSSQPSSPSGQPSSRPSRQPSAQPSSSPSRQPTMQPSSSPTGKPSFYGKNNPARTKRPSKQPTGQPTNQPSRQPSSRPTGTPTLTLKPTAKPTAPTFAPTAKPTTPTFAPTMHACTDMTVCCQNQKYIQLDASITVIPDNTFLGCTNITQLTFGGAVTSIGNNAFKGCTSLISITLPSSLLTLGTSVFQGCTSLASVTITPKYTSFNKWTSTIVPDATNHKFYCYSPYNANPYNDLKGSCEPQDSLKMRVVDNIKFSSTGSLIFFANDFSVNATIKATSVDIRLPKLSWVFASKMASTNILLNPSLYNAFDSGDTGSLGPNLLVDSTYEKYPLSFRDSSYFPPFGFSDALWKIPNNAFQGCTSLSSISLPIHITSIGDAAFSGCSSLSYAQIGDYMTYLGVGAFNLTSLQCVQWNSNVPRYGQNDPTTWPVYWTNALCPSANPTLFPTPLPTMRPSQPTGQPSNSPTGQPSRQPSTQPTRQPTGQPSTQPTSRPTRRYPNKPTGQPSSQPSSTPSYKPSSVPTLPTGQPSSEPTKVPSQQPSSHPTSRPSDDRNTSKPSGQPTRQPSSQPTSKPSSWLTTITPTATFVGAQFGGNVEFIPFTSKQCDVVHMKIVFSFQRNIHVTAFTLKTPGITSGPCYTLEDGKRVTQLYTNYSTPFTLEFVEGTYADNYAGSYIYVSVSNSTSANYFPRGTIITINIDRVNGLRKACGAERNWDLEGIFYDREQYVQNNPSYASLVSSLTGAEWASLTTNQYLDTLSVSDSYTGRSCTPLIAKLSLFPAQQQIMTEVNITLFLPFEINIGDMFIIRLPGFTKKLVEHAYSNYTYDKTRWIYNHDTNYTLVDVVNRYKNITETLTWKAQWREGEPPNFAASMLTLTADAYYDIGSPIMISIDRFKEHLMSLCGREANYTGFTIRSIPVDPNAPYMPTQALLSRPIGAQCNDFNDCSGHGTCDYCNNKCICYDGFGSANDILTAQSNNFKHDCSSRTCPAGRATATLPRAGLAGSSYHRDIECSNNGHCDRFTGACKCYAGFAGTACEKKTSTCDDASGSRIPIVLPDGSYYNPGKCSSKGECLSIKTLQYHKDALPLRTATYNYRFYSINSTGGFDFRDVTTMNLPAKAWDDNTHYACVCDSSWSVGLNSGDTQQAEYFGPFCQYRHCPSGDDPMTIKDETNCTGIAIFGGDVGQSGNLCHVDCSNRGMCDYSSGICQCFDGFYGSNCGTKVTYGESATRYSHRKL